MARPAAHAHHAIPGVAVDGQATLGPLISALSRHEMLSDNGVKVLRDFRAGM